ncbi:hypothetical protein AVEN_240163-1 [Araneus ventricosus]|uniref:Uncharacterized protein n=1 Tax=Araneus ventricosus TaxID=182803 RepID=A0A4Y2KV34_ARAVE|nr:hypothetical protein AVEN_240163-1 [Araneus ventricosus]
MKCQQRAHLTHCLSPFSEVKSFKSASLGIFKRSLCTVRHMRFKILISHSEEKNSRRIAHVLRMKAYHDQDKQNQMEGIRNQDDVPTEKQYVYEGP